MAKNNPLLTICIPTHNRANYLGDTIRSVLSQTYKNFELLICDDASIDNTQEVIKSFNDKRIKVAKNKKNLGYIKTMNKCTQLANGEWVMHLSDDDVMTPTMLEKQVAAIKKYQAYPIAYIVPQSANMNSKGDIISLPKKQLKNKTNILLKPTEAIYNFTLYGRKIKDKYKFNTSFPSTIFNKSILIIEGMSSEKVPVAHDLLIMAKLCLKYPVVFIDEPLFKYRVHENWGSSLNSTGKFLDEYKKFLELLFKYVEDNKIVFSYDFEKYCYKALVTYLFSINGGLVRLASRFKGTYLQKIALIYAYVLFGIHKCNVKVFSPNFYIALSLSLLPQRFLLWGGRILRQI